RAEACTGGIERNGELLSALRLERLTDAERVDCRSLTSDLLASIGVDVVRLQRPCKLVQILRRPQDAVGGRVRLSIAVRPLRSHQHVGPGVAEELPQLLHLVPQLPEQGRWLANGALQSLDG